MAALLRRRCGKGSIPLFAGLAACLVPATAYAVSLQVGTGGGMGGSLGSRLAGVASGAALTAGEIIVASIIGFKVA